MQTFKQFLNEVMDRDLFVSLVNKAMAAGPVDVSFNYDGNECEGQVSRVWNHGKYYAGITYHIVYQTGTDSRVSDRKLSVGKTIYIDDVDLTRFRLTDIDGVKTIVKRSHVTEEVDIYAKKIENAPEWSPAVAEHDYRIGSITFSSRHGLGSVGINANIWHEGVVVMMKPSIFMKLAEDDQGHQEPTSKELERLAAEGYAIGIPFLTFVIDEEGNELPRITGHEGRGRMRMIQRVLGDIEIPVHLKIERGLRSDYIKKNPEVVGEIKQGLYSQSGQLIKNPVSRVYVSMDGRYNKPGEEFK